MFRRLLEPIRTLLNQKKSPMILILGMRQVGKTTLAASLVEGKPFVRFNFDLAGDRLDFANLDRHSLDMFARKYKGNVVIIDEIQKFPEATSVVKHLYDTYDLKFILTGSSELKIRKGLGDSLAGRIHEVKLYPLSLREINIQNGLEWKEKSGEYQNYDFNQKKLLQGLTYGSLPNLQNIDISQYETYLNDYTNLIFSKDVLEIAGTRKPTQVYLLAKLLALQIGQLVNFNELAVNVEMSRMGVYKYIDVFEQMGLIVKAKPISTNERESITKATKIYFTDLGVRNSLVGNFDDFAGRPDKGQLLENAVFIGLKRKLDYEGIKAELGFFRSEYGSEIDIVCRTGNEQKLYEVKVGAKSKKLKKGVELITFENAQKLLY